MRGILDAPICYFALYVFLVDAEKQSGCMHRLQVSPRIQTRGVPPSLVAVIFGPPQAAPFQIRYVRGFQVFTGP